MSKRTKWLLSIGVIAALVMGFQIAAFAAHPEATLTGSNFEIDVDANLKVDDTGNDDWANVAENRQLDKVNGTGDNSYAGGVKEDTTCPAETTDSIPPNKSDLLSYSVYREPGTGGHPGFLNLAWSRVNDPSGTTLMDFEFNQSSTKCANGPNVVRTTGDLLIEYAIDQGGSRADITVRTWDGTKWGAPTDLDQPNPLCGNAPCAAGTINSSPIPAADSDGLISTGQMAPRTFGEAQIDLRLIFQANKCTTLGSSMLKSRSSDSFTSQLKDFVSPVPLSITNCGKVIIHKETVPDETDQNFDYTKTFNTDPATANTFKLNDKGTAGPPAVNDTITFNNVLFGTGYTVTEDALPAGWKFDSLVCGGTANPLHNGVTAVVDPTTRKVTFDIDAATDVLECTYTNSRLSSTLSTAQSFIPQDTATVGGEPNTGFDGTVDFRLYTGSTCAGTLVYEELNRPLSGTTAGSTANTTNDGTPTTVGGTDGYTITGTGTFSWKVTYEADTNTDGVQHPNVESCVENSSLTITNGGTASNPPAAS